MPDDRRPADADPTRTAVQATPDPPTTPLSTLPATDEMAAHSAERSAPPPPVVPGYDILGEIGRGGMGVVYRARQINANRIVGLKMILSGPHAGTSEVARFRREVEACARLKHPGIVQVYEVGEHAGLPFYSMEFVEGGSLSRHVAGKPLAPRAAAAIVERLARAVEAAHVAGIVHRDLKPANVLMADDGTPKVTDFGLAKHVDATDGQTRTGAVLGTPTYMAPEQAAGRAKRVGPAADVYALGVILFELLTGRVPFTADSLPELLQKVAHDPPPPPSALRAGLPRDLETICLKCLSKEPKLRYPTAGGLAEDLRRFQAGETISARELNAVARVAWMLGRSQHDFQFAKYAGFFFWLIPLMLGPELVVTLVRNELISQWWDLPALLLRPVGAVCLLAWYGNGRLWPASVAEQHMLGVWGGFVLTVLMLTACLGDIGDAGARSNRGMYQGYAAVAAVGFFGMGAIFWGGCYGIGVGFVLLMPVLGMEPKLAPLWYGLAWTAALLVLGRRLRQVGRESDHG